MSLARRAVLAASRTRPTVFAVQSRATSTSHDGHHDHHEDSTVYPPETFGTSFWRNVLFASFATAALVKFAPEAGDNVYLTRWIALYTDSRDHWIALNAKHTAQASEVSSNTLLTADAKTPPIHRFRYPQSLNQGSPFLNVIGETVDMSNVVAKAEKDI
ncbi:hypothetical protein CPB83DRAFT_853060 [Crepidotus variabilis]|uniref:Uncharacterized protein n=1 Tax=Crepidotus variabilis TaxID=179855 RepID=A0A9P6EHS8_9AGAR|nr:hypothetical protein CPB83DRAFT_853060 [Crepidotus variabilis]